MIRTVEQIADNLIFFNFVCVFSSEHLFAFHGQVYLNDCLCLDLMKWCGLNRLYGTPTTGGTPIDVSQPTDVAFRKEGKVGATTKKKKKNRLFRVFKASSFFKAIVIIWRKQQDLLHNLDYTPFGSKVHDLQLH